MIYSRKANNNRCKKKKINLKKLNANVQLGFNERQVKVKYSIRRTNSVLRKRNERNRVYSTDPHNFFYLVHFAKNLWFSQCSKFTVSIDFCHNVITDGHRACSFYRSFKVKTS